jgi:hypothetical protein
MKYYVLGCAATPYNRILGFPDIEEDNWMGGYRIADDIPTPLEFELDPDCPGIMREMYDTRIPVMRDDLVEAMHAAGVDNLQVFPAIIRDPETGERYANYKAVNIVGLISALDRAKADVEPGVPFTMVAMLLNSAPLDESRAGDARLFRLAENISMIVIHQSVKEFLQERGFVNLTFTNPAEWSG